MDGAIGKDLKPRGEREIKIILGYYWIYVNFEIYQYPTLGVLLFFSFSKNKICS